MSDSDSYSQFLRRKLSVVPRTGIAGEIRADGSLFDHQRALTNWALRRGSAAIFADTGLGKMRMELAWADVVHKHTRMPVMIHTPLAVATQLAAEAALMMQAMSSQGSLFGAIEAEQAAASQLERAA